MSKLFETVLLQNYQNLLGIQRKFSLVSQRTKGVLNVRICCKDLLQLVEWDRASIHLCIGPVKGLQLGFSLPYVTYLNFREEISLCKWSSRCMNVPGINPMAVRFQE